MLSILWLTMAFLLVLLNAFFVAAEFGMVRLRQTRVEVIEATYGLRGNILKRIHKELDAYLSACQLGITLASLGLGWIGEPAFSALLTPLLQAMGIVSPTVIEVLAFVIAFSILSFLHIVVGELMPKSMAIRQPEKISVWTAVPLFVFYWVMYPAIWFLNACSNHLLRISNLGNATHSENFYSADELKLILNASHVHGGLDKDQNDLLSHTLEFAELEVTDVMRPIDQMVALDIELPVEELLRIINDTRYSRYPVINKAHEFIGIIHLKNLFAELYQKGKITNLHTLINPILKVPADLPTFDLLRKFRGGLSHFAVIYHGPEYPVGFVTLDNLLHILVGRIKDEFHRTKDDWVRMPDGGILISGSSPLYSLERALDIDIPTEDEAVTIYGLITNTLQALPEVGNKLEFDDFTMIVNEMDGTKITSVIVYPKKDDVKK